MITQTHTPTRPVIPVFLAAYRLPRLECLGSHGGRDCPLKGQCECGHMGANAQAYGDRAAPDLYASGHCPAEGVLERLYAANREAA